MGVQYRKAWEIVAFAYDCYVVCAECAPVNVSDDLHPLFVSDDLDGLTCDVCGHSLTVMVDCGII